MPTALSTASSLLDLLSALCALIQRFAAGSAASSSPVAAWVPSHPVGRTLGDTTGKVSGLGTARQPGPEEAVTSVAQMVPGVIDRAEAAKEAGKGSDTVRLADAAKCEV